jgi:hypothetical protein
MSRFLVWLDFRSVLLDNFLSFGSILLFTLLLHVLFLRFDRAFLIRLFKGGLMVLAGLLLFLQGVNVGLVPAGTALAENLGRNETFRWLLIPLTSLFGFFLTRVEPAVSILCSQVERTTSGSIQAKYLELGICLGVAVFAGLGMARVMIGFSLLYILVPGYLLVLLLTLKNPPLFVGIAFDACTVTTGPMVITFVMSLTLGLAMVLDGRDPLLDGFGLRRALVALAPIIAVLLFGLAYQSKLKERRM